MQGGLSRKGGENVTGPAAATVAGSRVQCRLPHDRHAPCPTDVPPGMDVPTEMDVTPPTDVTPPADTGLCPTGQSLCGGQCVDTASSTQHCGACNRG